MFSRLARTITRNPTTARSLNVVANSIRPTSSSAVDLAQNKAFPALPAFPNAEQITKAMDAYVESTKLPTEQTFLGGLKQVISEYGVYPFIGLGSAILLSKEIFLINTEFVVLVDFCLLTFIGYVLGADKVNAIVEKDREATVDEINSVFLAEKQIYNAQLDACQAVMNTPKVVAEAFEAFKVANDAVAKARDLTQRNAYRESIVQKLQAIKLSEDEAANQEREMIRTKALQDVMELIQSPKTRAQVLDEAIALVGATEDKTGEYAALSKVINNAITKIQNA